MRNKIFYTIGFVTLLLSFTACVKFDDQKKLFDDNAKTAVDPNAPTFTPSAGTYFADQSVTLTSVLSGATICYTNNLSTPACDAPKTGCTTGTLYGGAVVVNADTTLKAIACKAGEKDSAVSSAAYVIDKTPPTVVSTTPAAAATGVMPCNGTPCRAKIVVQFSKSMNTGLGAPTLTTDILSTAPSTYTNAPVAATPTWSTTSKTNDTLTLAVSWVNFPENSQIQWTLDKTNLKDTGGNALAANVVQVFTTTAPPPALAWADTGQTQCSSGAAGDSTMAACSQAITGQDGDYADKPQARSFTASSPSGNDIVTDNVTGLVWKKCSEGLSGSTCATGTATNMTWYAAMNQCAALNAASYAGRSDWRLPTSMELETLPNLGTPLPAIDAAYFPATVSNFYWSSSTYASNVDVGDAWDVNFFGGLSNLSSKTTNYYVRCVAAGPSFMTAPFTDNGDGTVTDSRTNLRWQKCSNGLSGASCSSGTATEVSWVNAIADCESLNLGSFGNSTAWRLPSKNELVSIVDRSRVSPTIDIAAFPATVSAYYWSSSTYASNVNYAWFVNFNAGNSYRLDKTDLYYVRCVADN